MIDSGSKAVTDQFTDIQLKSPNKKSHKDLLVDHLAKREQFAVSIRKEKKKKKIDGIRSNMSSRIGSQMASQKGSPETKMIIS